MLTTPARPTRSEVLRNSWKLRFDAQSTVSMVGWKLGSDPVTHCAAAFSPVGMARTVSPATEPPTKVRRLYSATVCPVRDKWSQYRINAPENRRGQSPSSHALQHYCVTAVDWTAAVPLSSGVEPPVLPRRRERGGGGDGASVRGPDGRRAVGRLQQDVGLAVGVVVAGAHNRAGRWREPERVAATDVTVGHQPVVDLAGAGVAPQHVGGAVAVDVAGPRRHPRSRRHPDPAA